jgi:hypothetical protein
MGTEAAFWRLASNGRVQMAEFSNQRPDVAPRAALYVKYTSALAKQLQIENFPKTLQDWDGYKYGDPAEKVMPALYELEGYMGKIYAANILELDGAARSQFLILDATWKGKAGSYVVLIRDIVTKAQMEEKLRQNILGRLNALQGEIDRNQTRVEAFSETLIAITGAIGRGAKNLEPAVKLAERLAGSVFNLREDRDQQPPLQLPPPEALGLPDPGDDTSST